MVPLFFQSSKVHFECSSIPLATNTSQIIFLACIYFLQLPNCNLKPLKLLQTVPCGDVFSAGFIWELCLHRFQQCDVLVNWWYQLTEFHSPGNLLQNDGYLSFFFNPTFSHKTRQITPKIVS